MHQAHHTVAIYGVCRSGPARACDGLKVCLVAERSLVKTLQPTKEELCVPPQRSLGVIILRVVRRTLLQVLSRAQELGLNIIHGEPCVLVELGYYAPGGLGSSDGGGDP